MHKWILRSTVVFVVCRDESLENSPAIVEGDYILGCHVPIGAGRNLVYNSQVYCVLVQDRPLRRQDLGTSLHGRVLVYYLFSSTCNNVVGYTERKLPMDW